MIPNAGLLKGHKILASMGLTCTLPESNKAIVSGPRKSRGCELPDDWIDSIVPRRESRNGNGN